jgi:hypothetical protein
MTTSCVVNPRMTRESVWLQVGVSPKLFPILVSRDERNLLDGEASFEKAACSLMAQIVEVKIVNFEVSTLAAKAAPTERPL